MIIRAYTDHVTGTLPGFSGIEVKLTLISRGPQFPADHHSVGQLCASHPHADSELSSVILLSSFYQHCKYPGELASSTWNFPTAHAQVPETESPQVYLPNTNMNLHAACKCLG